MQGVVNEANEQRQGDQTTVEEMRSSYTRSLQGLSAAFYIGADANEMQLHSERAQMQSTGQ